MDSQDGGVNWKWHWEKIKEGLGCLLVFGIVVAVVDGVVGAVGDFVESATQVHPHDLWTGHVYPDPNDLTQSLPVGEYMSLETCVGMSLEMVNFWEGVSGEGGVYECGLNCRPLIPEQDDSVFICEDTQGTAP